MKSWLVGFLLIFAWTPALAQTMTVGELVKGLKVEIRALGSEGAARDEYRDFKRRHKLERLDYWTFLKVKVAFECSRDAGLWQVVWPTANSPQGFSLI